MAETIPLREKKKAKTKLALLQAGIELIGEGSFRQVSVEEICQQAEVSKVTFFKFFPQKEELLVYFMSIWQAECYVELEESQKRGWEAVRHILRKLTENAKRQPGLMLSLISFLAEQSMHPCVPILSQAELRLLFPEKEDVTGIAESNLGHLFRKCVREAKEAGELVDGITEDEAVMLLFTIFYGGYLSAHLWRSPDAMATYEVHLKPLMR
ncbi:TetR/AcrR family transcriptional regulator [Brevibacillus sp. TJ4]|uniref:TetR/AcrR family transcriptional regulator n=1 Tax=Brevibacillus sp. TJ4 TaxID=3234853 RepID=UPI0037D1796C